MLEADDEIMEESTDKMETGLTQTNKRATVASKWTRDYDLSGPKA